MCAFRRNPRSFQTGESGLRHAEKHLYNRHFMRTSNDIYNSDVAALKSSVITFPVKTFFLNLPPVLHTEPVTATYGQFLTHASDP
jgi:hypothetical protein